MLLCRGPPGIIWTSQSPLPVHGAGFFADAIAEIDLLGAVGAWQSTNVATIDHRLVEIFVHEDVARLRIDFDRSPDCWTSGDLTASSRPSCFWWHAGMKS